MRPLTVVAISLVLCFAGIASGSTEVQAEAVGPLQFGAASLKLAADQDVMEARPKRSVGRVRWNTTLLNLVSYAYNMEWWRISEIPGLSDIYTLEATTSPNTPQDQVRLMLQNLLIERFHLKTHRATRDVAEGYALMVASAGPKLQQSKPPAETESAEFDDGYIVGTLQEADTMLVKGHNASMLQLAEFLQRGLEKSVLDRTALTGRYDFELLCARDSTQDSPNLMASCIKQAGLVVQKYKGPVEFLVIDHLGKLVEN